LEPFFENKDFGPGSGHALSFQKKIAKVLIAAPAAQQRLDIAVDGFHDPQRRLHSAVVQDSFQVVDEGLCQLLKRSEPLPPQLVHPTAKVADHCPFITIIPEPVEAFFKQIGFKEPSV
jgi:hypothetical protein